MVTKELLKAEIERVENEHLDVLYRIIRALTPTAGENQVSPSAESGAGEKEWKAFVSRMYGSMAESPIERPPQGEFEIREPFD